ncbi:MAG: beta-lactamase family protein [Phycisphaerales bacterium]|nr:beta-lactamase family protein [Phycisphaerales bacterium]
MRTKPLLSLWFLPLAIGAVASAQPGTPVDISGRLEPIRAEFDLPALAALVTTADHTLAIGAVGVRQAGDQTAVTNDDLWHLGSCTKSMTGTLAAILVEQGRIAWSTTVADIFGAEFDDIDPAYLPVTLEQLMCHRAGVPTAAPPDAWSRARRQRGALREQRDAFVHAVLAAAPSDQSPDGPGTNFEYSNQGITIAGAMLERAWDKANGISATTWEDLATQQLFEPLGITTAGFGVPGTRESIDQPRGHARPLLPGGVPTHFTPGRFVDNPPAISPAGRVHMSLEDWARYIREHLRGRAGESQLLPREAWEHLHGAPDAGAYAMGWGTAERDWGGRVISHSGSNTMWFCVVWASPEQGFAVLVATNIGGDEAAKGADKAAGELIGAFARGEFSDR